MGEDEITQRPQENKTNTLPSGRRTNLPSNGRDVMLLWTYMHMGPICQYVQPTDYLYQWIRPNYMTIIVQSTIKALVYAYISITMLTSNDKS